MVAKEMKTRRLSLAKAKDNTTPGHKQNTDEHAAEGDCDKTKITTASYDKKRGW